MLAGVIKALKFKMRGSVPVRILAVVCAVAIFATGFSHSVHQSNEPVTIVAAQLDAGASSDLPDTPKKTPVVIEHCFGCSVVVLADLALPLVPHRIATDLQMQRVDEKRPHPPSVEIPPPIASI